ncbi:RNA-binding S4 domain-containing protein [Aliiroseovarius sp. F47248L]|uniref:RNA-binding S4 domain-containing protein n=1 Tax=Aliiroseovarius sp. F47248L TaxID=2926420 RepID=UPI001FF3DD18|nr:RNA-binding S4 domain-containing protein [Aliiroseovarius sp. F47248L]MCK0138606.1 RNA-binding S4 domain-containing protein [Aliiroseovarius sp. F47248L]
MRADKWLWHARFFKTRGLATKLIAAGHLRVNRDKVSKPSFGVGTNDVLTFLQGRQVRVIRILALSTRRGPAPEAQSLYDDLDPPSVAKNTVPDLSDPMPQSDRKGRPTKKDRRSLDLSRKRYLE